MKPSTRAAIAYIVGSLSRGTDVGSVYDHARGRHVRFSGTVRPDSVDVYDYDLGCHIDGAGAAGELSLYHYGDGHHIDLTVQGGHFEGYDFGSSSHFEGEVGLSSASIYDFEEGGFFEYSF